jgi:hypothetical protein
MILWFFQWLMVQSLHISLGLENTVCSCWPRLDDLTFDSIGEDEAIRESFRGR